MSAAYKTLRGKRNLLVSDRLAILGNLTHYWYGIDTHEVVQNNLSFTACVIGTALYNGDLSVLFCESDLDDPDSYQVPEDQHMRLWAWSSTCSLSNFNLSMHLSFSDRTRTGDPCLVLDSKALISGILWEVVPFHGFDQLNDVVGGFLEESPRPFRAKEGNIDGAGHILFQLVVELLLSLNRTDILELLLVSALPRQLSSPAEAFELIGELEKWRQSGSEEDWPKHILEKSALETTDAGVRLDRGVVGAPIILVTEQPLVPPYDKKLEFLPGHPWGNQILQWIYRAISKGMPLALGHCEIGGEALVSLFMLDPAKHSTVFTPLSELEYEYGASSWIHLEPKANFWVVMARREKVGDELIQRARNKLRTFGMHQQNISNEVFEIQNVGHVHGVWSPRLSRAGMLKRKSVGEAWEMHPLSKGKNWATKALYSELTNVHSRELHVV
jgi:hypothetical protein